MSDPATTRSAAYPVHVGPQWSCGHRLPWPSDPPATPTEVARRHEDDEYYRRRGIRLRDFGEEHAFLLYYCGLGPQPASSVERDRLAGVLRDLGP